VSVLSQEQIESVVKTLRQSATRNAAGKPRSVYACNFRSAGRLSNENARSLTAAHETFARHLASVLDAYLGTGLEVKLQTLDQLPIKEHIASIPPLTYIAPFSLTTMPSTMIVECDIADGLVPVPAQADDGSRFDAASILVRIFTEPIALLLVPLGEAGLSLGELAAEIEAACGEVVRRRIEDAGISWPGTVPRSRSSSPPTG